MLQEKEVKETVDRYIENKFIYKDNSDTLQEIKDEEIEQLVSHSIAKEISQTRPYPNVISDIEVLEREINVKNVRGTQALVELKVIRRVYPYDRENSRTTTQVVDEPLELNYQENGWVITGYDLDTVSLDREDDEDTDSDDYSNYTNGELIAMTLKNNIVKLGNTTYQHRGAPLKNPLENLEEYFKSDMYNLYYWALEENAIYHELDYPVDKYDFETTDTFYKVRDKGHKFESDILNFEEGDILFFGSNNTSIGVYIGDGQIITLLGNFPKDNTSPKVYTLKDSWWQVFNGMVYRLREDVVNGNE